MATQVQHQKCTICNSSGAKLCSSCRSASYCSPVCQKKDWPLHKTLCKSLKSAQRPSDCHRLAILFPSDSKLPLPIWVSCEASTSTAPSNSNQNPPAFNIDDVIGPPPYDLRSITANELRGFDIEGSVIIISKAKSDNIPEPNACIRNVTNGMARYKWPGTVVAMRIAQGTNTYVDATATDLRVVVDCFAQLPSNGLSGYIQGVKINCNGELRDGKFPAVDVPFNHPIFAVNRGPDIPKQIGLDVRIYRYPPNPSWTGSKFDNQAVTFLHMDANPHSPYWGFASHEWQSNVGSVLLVRADRKPITPRQVEVLTEYCWTKLQPSFESSIEANSLSARQRVFDRINKQGFSEFFESYKKQQMRLDIDLNRAISFGSHPWGEEKSPLEL
ncbi:hypothetical protein HYFRA_00004759 [Hymenoscyphus fraxineus]|uniref:MYND-type domain-containing protein n=1 Tax=Hymenoscyphus fraxineus TaxID=746836 RepID=A0A9N9KPA7_9HELO|nr:hypothetical protein HYFRA_00004759 [Hymenoscyphus fraxineus]